MADKFEEYFVQEKTGMDKILDFLVFISVFVVTIFLILEILGSTGSIAIDQDALLSWYKYVNIIVFIVFFADLVRLWMESEGAKDFIVHNWLDVLATIPFGLIASIGPRFEILKWTKIAKLTAIGKVQKASRISKISKEFKAASHIKKEGDEYKKKHRL